MRGVLKARPHTKSGGEGGSPLQVRYTKSGGGGGGQFASGPIRKVEGGIPLFGTKKILYR